MINKPAIFKPNNPGVNSILLLDSIVENSSDAILSHDTEGIILTWNHGAEKMFGYTQEEAIGKSIKIIVPEDHRDTFQFILDTVKKGEYLKYFETEKQRKDKSRVRVSLAASPVVEPDGSTHSCSLIIRDITRQLKAERLLKKLILKLEKKVKERTAQLSETNLQLQHEIQKQEATKIKLEKINTELTDFAHIVSHDLQAPLRGVSHLSEWIIEDPENKLSAESEANLELLRRSVTTMSQLITGILNYSKTGKSGAPKEKIDLNNLISEVLKNIQIPSTIKIEISEGMPVILFQKIQILQVFQNLIDNAVKYMDKPDGLIRIGFDDTGKFLRFFIKDNGPGIGPQYHERIFKMFATVPSSAPRKDSSGIGLAVVNKIIRESGGSIWVESTIGEGTIFYFTIPVSYRLMETADAE